MLLSRKHTRMLFLTPALAALVTLSIPGAAQAQAALAPDADAGARQRLTPEQRKALLDAMKQYLRDDDAGLKAVVRQDGTAVLDLQGRFQSIAVARMEDGRSVAGCVTNASEAEAFASGATADAHAHSTAEER